MAELDTTKQQVLKWKGKYKPSVIQLDMSCLSCSKNGQDRTQEKKKKRRRKRKLLQGFHLEEKDNFSFFSCVQKLYRSLCQSLSWLIGSQRFPSLSPSEAAIWHGVQVCVCVKVCVCVYANWLKRGWGNGSGRLQKGEELSNGFTDLHKI